MPALIISQIILLIIAFAFGASLASFGAVVVERGKRGESIMGRSHCVCGRQLKWYENVPVIGWLRIGGVTKCCHTKLPVSYVLTEIGAGLVVAIIAAFIIF